MENLATIQSAKVIDFEDAMDRFGEDEALFRRLAGKFTSNTHLAELKKALSDNDLDAAYRAAHSLKGVAGNLSFAKLYHIACIVSKALETGDRTIADEWMSPLEDAYVEVMNALPKL